jgi:signal transduction histidine kinase/CheY-like chemotaxis protein
MNEIKIEPDDATLEQYVFRRIAAEGHRAPFPQLVFALIFAGLATGTSQPSIILGWLVLVIFGLASRLGIYSWLLRVKRISITRKLQYSKALYAFVGCTHALSLILFFPAMPPFERALMTAILVGQTAGVLGSCSGYRPVFLSHMLPTLGTLGGVWLLAPHEDIATWIHLGMTLLVALYGVVLLRFSSDTYSMLRDSFAIRHERDSINRQLQAALNDAVAANRAKTRFLASASHDLRQPIQSVALFSSALLMRTLDDRSREIATDISEAIRDLAAELDALLDISKLDAGLISAKQEVLELAPLLVRIRDIYAASAEDKRLDLVLECSQAPRVHTDRQLLDRILRNLIENAIKYTDNGSITIRVARNDKLVTIAIIDTGRGIPAEEQGRVFEEFYQIENPSRDRQRGLGLGLSIVKRLSTLIGVRLELRSAVGVGTTVTLQLCAVDTLTPATEIKSTASMPQPPMRILVIDDEDRVRRGFGDLLTAMGHDVRLGASTDEAIHITHTFHPQVLVTDFRLHGSDNGLRTIEAMRQMLPAIHAILVSGDTAPERLIEAQSARARILNKPVSAEQLAAELLLVTAIRP